VVNLFSRGKLAVFFTLLTKRVSLDVPVTYPFPSPAVSFLCSGIAAVFLVSLGFLLGMLLTESTVC
jgi:hypothetical protein